MKKRDWLMRVPAIAVYLSSVGVKNVKDSRKRGSRDDADLALT